MIEEKSTTFVSKESIFQSKILEDFLQNKISRKTTATLISKSERQVSRLAKRFSKDGILGIQNKNKGSNSNNATPIITVNKIRELFLEKYADFNYKHFHEYLISDEKIIVTYSTLKNILRPLKIVKRPRKNRKIRRYRNRKTNEGILFQMDGSEHEWIKGHKWCIIAGIDDATSEVPYAEFFLTESLLGYQKVLEHVFALKGVPRALYVDHAAWLSGTTNDVNLGQFERMCGELKTVLIHADSPQAKGRIERFWGTLQDRLISELRLKKTTTMEEANWYLNEVFLKKWNEEFTLKPAKIGTLFQPPPEPNVLKEIFSLKFERKIGNDETVKWKNNLLQVGANFGYSLSKKYAEIRVYQDGSMSGFYAGKDLELKIIKPSDSTQQNELNLGQFSNPGLSTDLSGSGIFKQNCF